MHTFIVYWVVGIVALWTGAFVSIQSAIAQSLPDQASELLRTRIEAAGVPPKIMVGEELIHASMTLTLFYERRTYRPAWTGDDGPLPHVDALLKAITEANREGLKPSDYHLVKIEGTLKKMRQNQGGKNLLDPRKLVDLDLLLTDAFLIYGSHLLAGRINPKTIDPEWHANLRKADMASILQTALDSNQIEEALKNLLPPQPGYNRLKQALARYRDIAAKGGWSMVPPGPKMKKGNTGERVVVLNNRLDAIRDLERRCSRSPS